MRKETGKHLKSFFNNPLIFSQHHKSIITIEFKFKLQSLQSLQVVELPNMVEKLRVRRSIQIMWQEYLDGHKKPIIHLIHACMASSNTLKTTLITSTHSSRLAASIVSSFEVLAMLTAL
jgi:hypothetical protein